MLKAVPNLVMEVNIFGEVWHNARGLLCETLGTFNTINAYARIPFLILEKTQSFVSFMCKLVD